MNICIHWICIGLGFSASLYIASFLLKSEGCKIDRRGIARNKRGRGVGGSLSATLCISDHASPFFSVLITWVRSESWTQFPLMPTDNANRGTRGIKKKRNGFTEEQTIFVSFPNYNAWFPFALGEWNIAFIYKMVFKVCFPQVVLIFYMQHTFS